MLFFSQTIINALAKPLLMLYPDSMCYFDIDSELSFSAWFNFLKSFLTDQLKSRFKMNSSQCIGEQGLQS